MAYVSRRSALTIIAGGTALRLAAGRARAEDKAGRVIYPVAVPVYQTQFIADRIGYFKEAGLDCKLIQGGSGVKTREIIASSAGRYRYRRYHPSDAAQQPRPRRPRADAGRYPLQLGDVHHPKGSVRPGHHDAGSAHRLEAAGRPQADRLGLVARRHQPCLGLLLHGDDGARPEGDMDRDRQCRHHDGVR